MINDEDFYVDNDGKDKDHDRRTNISNIYHWNDEAGGKKWLRGRRWLQR